MDDEKRYSRRELIEAQREAFSKGAEWQFTNWQTNSVVGSRVARGEAIQRYPLPRVPRTVALSNGTVVQAVAPMGNRWAFRTADHMAGGNTNDIGDLFQFGVKPTNAASRAFTRVEPTPEDLETLASLLRSPYEADDA